MFAKKKQSLNAFLGQKLDNQKLSKIKGGNTKVIIEDIIEV